MNFLKGLKVIELASVLAGPSVGQFLAELGADVLKIENPNTNGDVTRSWKLPSENAQNSISAYFSCVNWGKQSLSLDITLPEDLQKLYQLIETTDIVVASYKPQDAKKLKVDYETFAKYNSKIIYGHITGYGEKYTKVGYDAIIQAEAGFMMLNGEADGNPVKMPVALIDILAGHQLKEAILLAILKKMQTGEGSYISVSLIESAVASLANQATNWLNAGHLPMRMGSEHPNICPYGTIFNTKDGKPIVLAVGTDAQFSDLCLVLEEPSLAESDLFRTNVCRVTNKKILLPILETKILHFEKKYLLENLHKKNVPAGDINTIKEVFEMPEIQEIILKNTSENIRGVRQFVAKFEGEKSNEITPPVNYLKK